MDEEKEEGEGKTSREGNNSHVAKKPSWSEKKSRQRVTGKYLRTKTMLAEVHGLEGVET